ncbi:hypothetical protein TrLO_g8745 [Triparma laevis f. longispina]|uniref:Uncharacterized protein n=1 Tax=Triparma laevis f. longispina TaxID=1714387 RepID=A0A9W7A4Y5_9STRA|nr:hypothetical protein TrLO_g8745 [Triparma laevis f. longispina]
MDAFAISAQKIALTLPHRFTLIKSSPTSSPYLQLPPFALPPPSPSDNDPLLSLSSQNLLPDPSLLPPTPSTSTPDPSPTCHISITFSETWSAPVLYFHLLDPSPTQSQTPTHINNRSVALQLLNLSPDDPRTYEIASMEYHPHTQVPSFFLHPCKTNETVAALTSQSQQNPPTPLLSFLNLNLKLFPNQNLTLNEIQALMNAMNK